MTLTFRKFAGEREWQGSESRNLDPYPSNPQASGVNRVVLLQIINTPRLQVKLT